MPSVWQDRFARYLKHLLNLRESTELSVLPDLMPVIPVADASAPEALWARGEAQFACAYNVAAVAGNYSTFVLQVPAGRTDLLAIIEHLSIRAPGAAGARFAFAAISPAVVQPSVSIDRRTSHPALPQLETRAGNTAGLYTAFFQEAAASLDLPYPIILAAGSYLACQCDTVNVALLVRAKWRERSVATSPEAT